jgi:hypothetical protein
MTSTVSPKRTAQRSSAVSGNARIEYAANVFLRQTLLDTVTLLRHQNPSLALRIQNLLVAPSSGGVREHITLQLDGFTLKRVVDTLAEVGNSLAQQVLQEQSDALTSELVSARETEDKTMRELTMMRDVIGQWLNYARFHQSEYAKHQQTAG